MKGGEKLIKHLHRAIILVTYINRLTVNKTIKGKA
jgi:hypothetical protein